MGVDWRDYGKSIAFKVPQWIRQRFARPFFDTEKYWYDKGRTDERNRCITIISGFESAAFGQMSAPDKGYAAEHIIGILIAISKQRKNETT